jgi:hypothetical protein
LKKEMFSCLDGSSEKIRCFFFSKSRGKKLIL